MLRNDQWNTSTEQFPGTISPPTKDKSPQKNLPKKNPEKNSNTPVELF